MSCEYPYCTHVGKCPVTALANGRRCAGRPREENERRQLDALSPLGLMVFDVWRDR